MNKKMFFPVSPIRNAKIDVVYMDRFYPPKLGIHTGWDINGVGGGNTDLRMPFRTIYDGKVVFATDLTRFGSWGGLIVVYHEALKIWSRYGHHQAGTRKVKVGDELDGNQVLAGIGRGRNDVFFAHLHFDIFKRLPPNNDWGYWPMNDLDALDSVFLDPRDLFDKFDVVTPRIPRNEAPKSFFINR